MKRIARVLGVAIVASIVLVVGARFRDGPLGPLSGGALVSGELVTDPVVDWSRFADVPEIALQLTSQSQSRTTWLLVHEGEAYVPADLRIPPWKRWPYEAERAGDVVLRIEGRRYERRLERVADPALAAALRGVVQRKYGREASPEKTWFFHVLPRRG